MDLLNRARRLFDTLLAVWSSQWADVNSLSAVGTEPYRVVCMPLPLARAMVGSMDEHCERMSPNA